MGSPSFEDIVDIAQATESAYYKRGGVTDLTSDIQEYYALPKLLTEEKVTIQDGKDVRFKLMFDDNGAGRWTQLYDVDQYNRKNVLAEGVATWTHFNTSWSIDTQEVDLQGGETKIVDLMKTQRDGARISEVKMVERAFWAAPTSSADLDHPCGVAYSIVKTGSGTGSFAGTVPSGWTTVYGITPNTAAGTVGARWMNWCFEYGTAVIDDEVDKVAVAMKKCGFRPPVSGMATTARAAGQRFGLYTTFDNCRSLEKLVKDQNDNLGNELDIVDGTARIRKATLNWVPELDDNTSHPLYGKAPIYGIDWNSFFAVVKSGWWRKPTGPRQSTQQRLVIVCDYDTTMQFLNVNRRASFVGATA